MEQFVDTIETLIVWFFILGAILWGWLHWIIRRQKKKQELADFELEAAEDIETGKLNYKTAKAG